MKSHLYNTSLSGQPIPEDDVLEWAAGSSCTSLEDQEYPQDILGVSWGSYLQSGPPTAGRSSRKVVINATPQTAQSKPPPISAPSAVQSPTRSILRTPLAKEGDPHGRKLSCVTDEPHPLLYDLQSLFDTLAATKDKIGECGASNSPLVTLCDSLLGLRTDLKQAVVLMVSSNDANNNRVLSVLLELFKRIIQSLAKQGKKLQDQAVFLQQMGKQLNKSQMDFMKEQENVQHALESARAQLMVEKQELDERKAALNLTQEEFTQHLTDLGMLGRTKSSSTHILASTMPGQSGHMQMVSMIQTQREQSKLERMLLQQQRELRKLQRAHEVTKAELLTAQEHGRRLQQKLTETSREARRNTVMLSNQLQTAKDSLAKTTRELEIEKRKSEDAIGKARRRERVLHTVKGISTTQKALNLEIERMQQQLSDQQRTGHYLWQELGMSHRPRGTTRRSTTSQHATATSRATANKVPGRRGQGRKQGAGEGSWPHEKKQKLKKAVSSTSTVLPTLPQSHQAPPRKKNLPSYRFSKSELITLTQFDDPDTAQQVIEWLGQQGKLIDT